MRGYLRGLSSPSGTLSSMTRFWAPVSNSAGQMRLPTFSSTTRSKWSAPSSSSAVLVMPASMWHMPPVWAWTALAPSFSMRTASTSESTSASMTAISNLSFMSRMVRSKRVVFPAPGDAIRLMSSVPFSFSSPRKTSASRSLDAVTVSFSSMMRIVFPFPIFLCLYCKGLSRKTQERVWETSWRGALPPLTFFIYSALLPLDYWMERHYNAN